MDAATIPAAIGDLPAGTAWSRWIGTTNADLNAGYPSRFARLSLSVEGRCDFIITCGGGSAWGLTCYRYAERDGEEICWGEIGG